jgi:hypothetical protein
MIGFNDVDDSLHDRRWREELTAVVRALFGELGQEVFVNAPENVTRRGTQALRVEHPHHFFKDAALEATVVFGQLASQRWKGGFNRLHCGC